MIYLLPVYSAIHYIKLLNHGILHIVLFNATVDKSTFPIILNSFSFWKFKEIAKYKQTLFIVSIYLLYGPLIKIVYCLLNIYMTIIM